MKRTKVAAIDVGTTKVCTILGDVDTEGTLRILGVGVGPSQGLQKGLVVNVNEAKEAIRESVKKAESTAGYKVESAYIGVTGRHISSVNNHGVIAITRGDQLVRPARSQESPGGGPDGESPCQIIKCCMLFPRLYVVDGQEGVKNPVGMHGFRPECRSPYHYRCSCFGPEPDQVHPEPRHRNR